nr:MAG TPA: hypothetical protein [Caudoviricetes sp.]
MFRKLFKDYFLGLNCYLFYIRNAFYKAIVVDISRVSEII